VTNTLDDGSTGSLRDAVRLANMGSGGDTIDFDDRLSGQTIRMSPTRGMVTLSKSVTITAAGLASKPIIDGGYGGGGTFTEFAVSTGVTVTMNHLTLTNARGGRFGGAITSQGNLALTDCLLSNNTAYDPSGSAGGGVYAGSGSLTVNHCQLTGNTASAGSAIETDSGTVTITNTTVSANFGSVAAIQCSGTVMLTGCSVVNNNEEGLFCSSAVTLTDTTVSGNTATGLQADGGGMTVSGLVTLTQCTISDNKCSQNGGGIAMGAGRLTLTDCTVAGNSAANQAGAIINRGELQLSNCTVSGNTAAGTAGLYNDNRMTLTNCTVSGNTSRTSGPGGILNANQNFLTLTSCTVTLNSCSGSGGGISNSSGTFTLKNTIVAGNTAGSAPDISGSVSSQGYNLIQNTSGATISGILTGNIYDKSPQLGPLKDNGGPTQTHALLPGSPAIDAGDPALAGSTDQRGILRQALPEIGAYEISSPVRFRIDVAASTTAGDDLAVTIRTVDVLGNPVSDYTGTVTLTSSDPQAPTLGSHTFSADDDGVFTFTDGVLKTAGMQTLIVADDMVARTASVQVNPAAVSYLVLTAPDQVTADEVFEVIVTAYDAYGNVATGYTGTVGFTSSDEEALLERPYTFTAEDAGTHTFRAVLHNPGEQTLTVVDQLMSDLGDSARILVVLG
jgi:parallel beta-helix repeat protein